MWESETQRQKFMAKDDPQRSNSGNEETWADGQRSPFPRRGWSCGGCPGVVLGRRALARPQGERDST